MLHIKKTSTDLLVHIISQKKIHTHFRIENTKRLCSSSNIVPHYFNDLIVDALKDKLNRNFVLKSPKSTIKTGSHVQKKNVISFKL